MDIEEQFNLISKEYDCKRKKFIPCYKDFYDSTTKFIASNIKYPNSIIDLGAGTGLLTSFWYKYFPNSEYLLVDIANDMLEIAKKRFLGIQAITFDSLNYINCLPDKVFDVAISALSIHHLNEKEKELFFNNLYHSIVPNGVFVNYDQFCAENKIIDMYYNEYWIKHLYNCGLTERDLELWEERKQLDKEISVAREINMLKNSKFSHVECIYSAQKFSVILAIK